ncbi:putative nuclease HARBI1 isoform X2 [Daphnia magna]|uniref:putative nuclease HARBI1 isoform X2 n=1 Tax=Daphnia magna TaxID=35525 RepID=UPI001E1BCAAC|nr:putative nuclease HARBI1 isoform X2 [Daphnia magna]
MEVEVKHIEFEFWRWKIKMSIALIQAWRFGRILKYKALQRKRRPLGRKWTRKHNTAENREKHSWYNTILKEAAVSDHYTFITATRMTPTIFEGLLQRIAQVGHKQDTTFRKCIPLGARLAMSLRYFATGDSLQSIAFGFRCGKSTASEIVIEMAKTIFTVLSPEFLRVPTTSEWKEIASDFFIRWNFANCCGAIDGKHVSIRCPGNSGLVYYNYKGFFSIVLMAMCDAKYRFTLYDIGAYGRECDKNVYSTSHISKSFDTNSTGFPPDCSLPFTVDGDYPEMPHVVVADDAFSLKRYMLKPYPGRTTGNMPRDKVVFNYRLSRARRIIENAFGIMSARFQLFLKSISADPKNMLILLIVTYTMEWCSPASGVES